MIIYSHSITPRLEYIAGFIGKETFGEKIQLTTDLELFLGFDGPRINYSNTRVSGHEFWLKPHTLLFERGIQQQVLECFEWKGDRVFLKTTGDFPLDIFAAGFYLLSRYEEYLPHKKDMYGRYAHENSLAFRENFLHLPLINLWLENFKEALKQKFPGTGFAKKDFRVLPTYDIDEAFCYRHKAGWRTWGGYARSVITGRWREVKERRNVLNESEEDPYDSFEWIRNLHERYQYPDAHFFFLVAAKTGRYDKNISPFNKILQNRIRSLFKQESPPVRKDSNLYFKAGLHPSWQSGDKPKLIRKEMDLLQSEIGVEPEGSRQHFIRFTLPETFRQLLNAGIRSDYSMGYGSINGFRASVASSFYWYDLEKEEQTDLELHPFCFMDANSYYEQKNSAHQALEEMLKFFNIIKSVNGTMITIWHNTFLGTQQRFVGWKEVYEEFIRRIYYQVSFVNAEAAKEGMDRKYFLH